MLHDLYALCLRYFNSTLSFSNHRFACYIHNQVTPLQHGNALPLSLSAYKPRVLLSVCIVPAFFVSLLLHFAVFCKRWSKGIFFFCWAKTFICVELLRYLFVVSRFARKRFLFIGALFGGRAWICFYLALLERDAIRLGVLSGLHGNCKSRAKVVFRKSANAQ